MQVKNWNDLRYLLAIKRGRTLSAAARLTSVDDTTVSRRLAVLQSAFETQLCRRLPNGSLQLTSRGEQIVRCVERMEHQIDVISEILGAERDACVGAVRLTSVPIIVNRLLTPKLGKLLDAHPKLEIQFVPESRDFSLTRREADLALRLARPKTGGTRVKARRIGQLEFAVYIACDCAADEGMKMPWITYDDTMAHLPQAQWVARAIKSGDGGLAGLRVHDAETALEAARAGLGRTLLPTAIADTETGLRRFEVDDPPASLSREIWLLAHSDQLALRRIAAVIAWVETVLRPKQS